MIGKNLLILNIESKFHVNIIKINILDEKKLLKN